MWQKDEPEPHLPQGYLLSYKDAILATVNIQKPNTMNNYKTYKWNCVILCD